MIDFSCMHAPMVDHDKQKIANLRGYIHRRDQPRHHRTLARRRHGRRSQARFSIRWTSAIISSTARNCAVIAAGSACAALDACTPAVTTSASAFA